MSTRSYPAAAGSDAPFDPRYHQEEFVANGLETCLVELLPVFARSAAEKFARMEECLLAGNLPEIATLSHSLKGEAAALGAPHVRRCAAVAEEAARAGSAALVAELLPHLGHEVRKVAAAVAATP